MLILPSFFTMVQPFRYTPACKQLIAQFKTASSLLVDVVPDLEKFMKEYSLDCPAAAKRIKIGVPATIEFGDAGSSNTSGHYKNVAEIVQVNQKMTQTKISNVDVGTWTFSLLNHSLFWNVGH